jgi:hypothetical protein
MRKPWPTRAVLLKCNLSDPATACSALWPNLLYSIKVRVTSKLSIDEKRTIKRIEVLYPGFVWMS